MKRRHPLGIHQTPSTGESWISSLGVSPTRNQDGQHVLVGVLPGEGIGPEVIDSAVTVLKAALSVRSAELSVEVGGCIGRESEAVGGAPLPADVVDFCQNIFHRGGAILNGPGGGRYVYELRREFDLFFKISPLQADKALFDASPFRPERLEQLDLLVVRENSGGIYQGSWEYSSENNAVATHRFEYSVEQVTRFLEAAARLANQRRGEMAVIWKESGIPAISELWRDCAERVSNEFGVEYSMIEVDLMAYRLIEEPKAFDVVVTPNLFGDVLGDLGAVLLGSRGISYSGNYNSRGHAVYQTNHGAAYDLAGSGRANPIGQIFSVSMMLRESFGFYSEANAIEQAVRDVWQEGWRTADMQTAGSKVVGTQEMTELIVQRIVAQNQLLKSIA